MGRFRILTAVAGVLFLGAPAQAQAPSVGDAVANPAVLARLFAAACLESGSLFEAQTMLANAGMVPNPETGTYFHQQFDMSVNPAGQVCSMVFAANQDGADRAAFRQSTAQVIGPRSNDIEIVRIEDVEGLYLRASIEGQW